MNEKETKVKVISEIRQLILEDEIIQQLITEHKNKQIIKAEVDLDRAKTPVKVK